MLSLYASSAAAAATSECGSKPNLWAFDFDGVVCDSVGESSLSAFEVISGLPGSFPPVVKFSYLTCICALSSPHVCELINQ
jgi:hypothetical protein